MPFLSRLGGPGTRKAGAVATTIAAVVLFAACGGHYPDSIFHPRTDFNRDVGFLFKLLIYAGTAVFVVVEAALIWTLIRYRGRAGRPEPKHVHGNTALEITWTTIPLVILAIIAVPTVRTIAKTQAAARSDAIQIEVIGHQWWWEFRYPQFTTVGLNGKTDTLATANELYLPIGRTANFALKTVDVIHSFWVPSLGGKRDLIANRTNYLWFTPDSAGEGAWNGACAEYCGDSHANMRFKTFTISQADFDSWAAHQLTPAAGSTPPAAAPVTQAGFVAFPHDKLPGYAIPKTPLPAGVAFDDNLLASGNAEAGQKLVSTGMCIACHTIRGIPMMQARVGPNLTHLATRTTIAGGIYPNDPRHLARWIKNSAALKPGSKMNSFGLGQYDPITKASVKIGYTDQQIADVVAYLTSLK